MNAKKKFIINFAYYACWMLIVYAGFTYFLPVLLPFVFGYLFSMVAHRILRNQGTLALVLIYIVIGIIFLIAGVWLVNSASEIVSAVPGMYENTIKPLIMTVYENLSNLNEKIDFPYINELLASGLDAIKNIALSLGTNIVNILSKSLLGLPTMIVSVLTFVISSFFFTADYENVNGFIRKYFGGVYTFVMTKLVIVLAGYIKIMAITFVELSIGLLIIGEKTPLLIALAIAVVDILPILGCGTVLIPWGFIALITGDLRGIGILILYVVIFLIRQYIEPKIVGQSLEIPATVSLISMVIGLRFFGFSGMIGMPLIMSYFLYYRRERDKQEAEKAAAAQPTA